MNTSEVPITEIVIIFKIFFRTENGNFINFSDFDSRSNRGCTLYGYIRRIYTVMAKRDQETWLQRNLHGKLRHSWCSSLFKKEVTEEVAGPSCGYATKRVAILWRKQ